MPSIASRRPRSTWGPAVRGPTRTPPVKGKQKSVEADKVDLDAVEFIHVDARIGFGVRLGFAYPNVSFEEDGRKLPIERDVPDILQRIPSSFAVDSTNKLRERGGIN